jgi:hypothetical protein
MQNSPLEVCFYQFDNEISNTNSVLKELKKIRIEVRSGDYVHLDNRKIELFACLYFLKIHVSWEAFLESSFTRYICGYNCPSGNLPKLLIKRQSSITSALNTILNGKNYVNWSPDDTINRSKLFFLNGEPYLGAISSAKHELKNIYLLRNSIAHSSLFAHNNFRMLVRSEIGYNPRGMTPGRFLLTKRVIPGKKQITYLEYYLNMFRILGNQIIP